MKIEKYNERVRSGAFMVGGPDPNPMQLRTAVSYTDPNLMQLLPSPMPYHQQPNDWFVWGDDGEKGEVRAGSGVGVGSWIHKNGSERN